VDKGLMAERARVATKKVSEFTRRKSALEISSSSLPGKTALFVFLRKLIIYRRGVTQPEVLQNWVVPVTSKHSCLYVARS